jgi:hypothetical protein
MKQIFLLLLVLLAFACKPVSPNTDLVDNKEALRPHSFITDNRLTPEKASRRHHESKQSEYQATTEYRAVKAIFDSVELDTSKDERLGVLIVDSIICAPRTKPSRYLAWFKYCCTDTLITANYVSFPMFDKFSDIYDILIPPHPYEKRADNTLYYYDFGLRFLLMSIASENRIDNLNNIKRIIIPLPIGLQNDNLLNDLIANVNYTGLHFDCLANSPHYYLGFKSNTVAFLRDTYNFFFSFEDIRRIET